MCLYLLPKVMYMGEVLKYSIKINIMRKCSIPYFHTVCDDFLMLGSVMAAEDGRRSASPLFKVSFVDLKDQFLPLQLVVFAITTPGSGFIRAESKQIPVSQSLTVNPR